MLTPQDYSLWTSSSRIKYGKSQVSEDGQWITYTIKNLTWDSTILRNIKTKLQYDFISSTADEYQNYGQYGSWNFSNNSKWFAVQMQDSLTVLTLRTGNRQTFYGAKDFLFLAGSNKILISQEDTMGKSLLIHDLVSGSDYKVAHVKEYILNSPQSMAIILMEQKGVKKVILLKISAKCTEVPLASGKDIIFNSFSWDKKGTAIAFFERAESATANTLQGKMYLCQNLGGKITTKVLTPGASPLFAENKNNQLSKMLISDNGKQLFFSVHDRKSGVVSNSVASDTNKQAVQIWAFNALEVPLVKSDPLYIPYWYCWASNGNISQITNEEYPFMFLNGNQEKAFVYHKRNYLPQYKYVNRFVDIYIKDLLSGNQKLVLEKVKDQPDEFLTSPTGKFIAYFKNRNWWVYDIAADTHRCITEGLGLDLESYQYSSTGVIPPYGNPGWLENDNNILLYDKFDIWIISVDGSRKQKITNGASANMTFRIFDTGIGNEGIGSGNIWFDSTPYSSKEGILLTSVNNTTQDNGLWWWSNATGLIPVINKNKTIVHSSKPAINKPLLYLESDFNMSPRLMLLHTSGVEECIYRTNPQQDQFYWGKSEVVHYQLGDGKQLNGALFYPANYDSTKKYPMVVEIYEKRAKEVHRYTTPSMSIDQSTDVINPVSFTSNGYFVLFPDIEYTLNNPGVSAARCVIAAVQSLIDKNLVDKDKIGLTGHSFGGYETSFIITQTNLFKAAIAGAGITDLPNYYLSMSEAFGSNITRVEEDQFRMNAPFYSNEYRQNSPMDNIATINTPILLWSGDRDPNVDWTQTRNFHVALWRLGKKSNLLVYPGEGHVLDKKENELDLATRIRDWFDYYLKGQKPADWIIAAQGN